MAQLCDGSGTFPTTYDGEYTRCEKCGRKLKLHLSGKLPLHRPKAARTPRVQPPQEDGNSRHNG